VTDLADPVGVAVLVVSLPTAGITIVLLRGRLRPSGILEALVLLSLVRERRQRFRHLLVLLASFFVLTGVPMGLRASGVVFPFDPDLPETAAFLAGMIAMGLASWTAFRPRSLSPDDRADLERDAPSMPESLDMAPHPEPHEPPEGRRNR
jgi:hypothetical protein